MPSITTMLVLAVLCRNALTALYSDEWSQFLAWSRLACWLLLIQKQTKEPPRNSSLFKELGDSRNLKIFFSPSFPGSLFLGSLVFE